MGRPIHFAVVAVAASLFAGGLRAQDPERGVVNWPAPLYWSPGGITHAPAESRRDGTIKPKSLTSVPTSPVPFIGITPCRIVDTRDPSRPPGYGPPSLAPGVANGRNFTLTGQCGIPPITNPNFPFVQAVSLNITVTNTLGPGYIVTYPQDGSFPPVSTLNYFAGQTVANAAVVPLGTDGGITVVAGVSGTDLIIDANGYYAAAGVGNFNTFSGSGAGNFTMTGDQNTGFGAVALSNTTAGGFNTAIGSASLAFNTTGSENTAIGSNTLEFLSAGSRNIALGSAAGYPLTSGDDNIYIGRLLGAQSESGMIRIGNPGVAVGTFIAGIRGVSPSGGDGIPVLVDSNNQLGTASSSMRSKEDIQDMAEASSRLLKLRPVTFRYKAQAGDRRQFGLIAEEVEEVLPELVVCDPAGEAETVLYHEMPAMILNELQKQERRIERQQNEIAALRALLETLGLALPVSAARQ